MCLLHEATERGDLNLQALEPRTVERVNSSYKRNSITHSPTLLFVHTFSDI